ncbi:MAG: hypothetical protein HZC38_12625 [Chloroflexi bacterium]|nr:hypothetical protein [Chloroflexota bacterium]
MTDVNEIGYWRRQPTAVGIFKIIDDSISKMLDHNPASMPDLRRASTLLITSDYSGANAGSKYQVLSFLVTSIQDCQKWEGGRRKLRLKFLSDNRRMSFKGLNDSQKQQALRPFLESADNMPGLVFTVAIDSSIKTLFEGDTPINLSNPDFLVFKSWKPKVLEKAFRTIHFLSFILAGVSRPLQNVLWFSDEDEIAANTDRIKQLTNLVAWVSSSYLDFNLGHLRCGTTQSDDGSMQLEDLATIPDMIAGAIAEQINLPPVLTPNDSKIFWIHRGDYSTKTSFITMWLTDVTKPLKKLFCLIDATPDSDELKISLFHFHNQS